MVRERSGLNRDDAMVRNFRFGGSWLSVQVEAWL